MSSAALVAKTTKPAYPLAKAKETRVLVKWSGPGLNRRHMDFQSIALPTELPDHWDPLLACSGKAVMNRKGMMLEGQTKAVNSVNIQRQ
jgi:hypothetical protein